MGEPTTKPIITLPPGAEERLARMEAEEAEVRRKLELMKELGIDTAPLEEKMDWATQTRKTLQKAARGE